MKNILVAIDDHEAVTAASPIIARTLELATAFSSKVWLLHIVPPARQPPFNIDKDVLRKEMAGELHHEHKSLHHLAESLRERHADVTALLVEGAIIRSILDESERLDIDLIVLGCHRHGLLY
ncbi:MAG: universal stress protein, partial [Thiogranum sp.]